MKKNLDKAVILLGQSWFGISNPFSSAFSTYEGATGKAVVLLNGIISFSALVAVAILIYGGYSYITAGGDSEKIEGATHMITTAIIGLGIIFTAGLAIRFLADSLL